MLLSLSTICAFAAHWTDQDKTHLSEALTDKNRPTWYKLRCMIHLSYLEDASRFETFDKLVAECHKANVAFGINDATADVEEVGRIVHALQTYFSKYNEVTFEYVKNNRIALYWYVNGNINIGIEERWTGITSCLLNYNNYPATEIYWALNKAFSMDVKIAKDVKIETYSLLYEKLYLNILDEKDLPADKKIYTKIVTKLAMKLKAMGVDVK